MDIRARAVGTALIAVIAAVIVAPVLSQQTGGNGSAGTGALGRYLATPDQVVAIRAGRLFDARSGEILENQLILVRGDRIENVGGQYQHTARRESDRPECGYCASRHD